MKVQISETMSKKVYVVGPTMSLEGAFQYLRECRVRHLVVVDPEGFVIGVISDRDFQRAMVSQIEKNDTFQVINEYFNPSHLVQDFMSWEIQSINESASLRQVALRMLECKISSLIVVNDNNQMVGFLTTDDMLWTLVKLIDEEPGEEILLDLKAQILNSPIGSIVNTLNQAGI